jgi:hypothetical protein
LQKGGADAAKIVKDFLPILKNMHLKDYKGWEHYGGYCPLGLGQVDLAVVLDMANHRGTEPDFTIQKQLKWGWLAQSGYVATRTIHSDGLTNMNAGLVVGAGEAGQSLYAEFGRSATTNVYYPWGSARYDSVQSTLERRFAQGVAGLSEFHRSVNGGRAA